MTDMLVNLYGLPSITEQLAIEAASGLRIVRALASDRREVLRFVEEQFGNDGWVGECETALAAQPSTCLLAVQNNSLIGFACYDSTARGFFGPFGIADAQRGRGLGRLLLIDTLTAMTESGYGYAIIGWVHSEDWYRNAVGAHSIPDSTHGIYQRRISATAAATPQPTPLRS